MSSLVLDTSNHLITSPFRHPHRAQGVDPKVRTGRETAVFEAKNTGGGAWMSLFV